MYKLHLQTSLGVCNFTNPSHEVVILPKPTPNINFRFLNKFAKFVSK
jgi:hypothetical protein